MFGHLGRWSNSNSLISWLTLTAASTTHQRRPSKKKEGKKAALTTKNAPPQTTQTTKMKQPAIRRALRRADTLAAVKSAPKRKRSAQRDRARLVREARRAA